MGAHDSNEWALSAPENNTPFPDKKRHDTTHLDNIFRFKPLRDIATEQTFIIAAQQAVKKKAEEKEASKRSTKPQTRDLTISEGLTLLCNLHPYERGH